MSAYQRWQQVEVQEAKLRVGYAPIVQVVFDYPRDSQVWGWATSSGEEKGERTIIESVYCDLSRGPRPQGIPLRCGRVARSNF